jgi:predicted DNA-binding transcriptional regulator YafY
LTVRFRAGGMEEMVHHLATWGSSVMVAKPDTLRERLTSFAREVLLHHQPTAG